RERDLSMIEERMEHPERGHRMKVVDLPFLRKDVLGEDAVAVAEDRDLPEIAGRAPPPGDRQDLLQRERAHGGGVIAEQLGEAGLRPLGDVLEEDVAPAMIEQIAQQLQI